MATQSNYEQLVRDTVQQVPVDRESIKNLGETFGQEIAQRAKSLNISPSEFAQSVQRGMEHWTDTTKR
jgi:hypothetical protein